MDDEKITALLQSQKIEGLKELIDKYKGLSCSVAISILGNHNTEDALECVNDAFYEIWISFYKYNPNKSSLKGWIALITRRRAIDRLRKNIHTGKIYLNDFPADIFDEDPADIIISQEEISLFNSFLKNLSAIDYNIFTRRYFMFESISAIAEHLNLSRAAVDNRLSRSRKSIHEFFERSIIKDE